MPATTRAGSELLKVAQRNLHPRCVVCGQPGRAGLGMEFNVQPNGSVTGRFDCCEKFEGYSGMLHGGIIAAIADGAMTNCLFAHGIAGVTAELNVRFRHPIELGTPLTVTARITHRSEPLFLVEAKLTQAGQLKVKATGKFMETPQHKVGS